MGRGLVGILAGMGPRSTAPFIDLVIDECQSQYGAKYDEEFPEIMIYSLPAPFYIDRPIDHEKVKKTIIGGLKKLESTGAGFIAMPCNSAHIYYNELAESINIRLLNIVEETLKNLPSASQRVTIFSTASTFNSGIYQKGIIDHGHKFIFNDEWQTRINDLILGIKKDKGDPWIKLAWNELIEDVKKESVENIILACTDLNVISDNRVPGINITDASKCLAKATIGRYLELQKKGTER